MRSPGLRSLGRDRDQGNPRVALAMRGTFVFHPEGGASGA